MIAQTVIYVCVIVEHVAEWLNEMWRN